MCDENVTGYKKSVDDTAQFEINTTPFGCTHTVLRCVISGFVQNRYANHLVGNKISTDISFAIKDQFISFYKSATWLRHVLS